MSFQSYLNNIEAKTGKNPAAFRAYAAEKGWISGGTLDPAVKASTIVADLKQQFGLGHGHAMAIVALLKGTRSEGDA